MAKLFKIDKGFISSLAFLLYLIIINRASYLSSLVFFILLFIFFLLFKIKINKTLNIYIYISMLYVSLGILNGNQSVNIFLDFFCFTPLILLVANDKHFMEYFIDNNLAGLNRLLPYLLIASLGLFMYMGYNWIASAESRFDYDSDTKLLMFAPLTPIFMVPFMLCYSNVKYNKFFLYLGALFIMYIGFLTQTKSVFIPVILVFILKFIIGKSLNSKIKLIFFSVIFSWFSYLLLIKYVPNSVDAFVAKFEINNESNLDRINESSDYLNKCNTTQLLFGKGFGGVKTFNGEKFIGGEDMIHIGIVHLIMKGGIFLLSIMYIPLLFIIVKDTINKNYPYVFMAIIFIIMDLSHTQWQTFTSMIVYWLLVYYRFYKKENCEKKF